MDKELNFYERIQAVSNEVRNIEKDITISTGGTNSYKAVSDTAVILAVKDAEKKYRILSIPIRQELVRSDIQNVERRNGTTTYYVDIIRMVTRIIDLNDPTVFIEVESFGRGLDSGDKGLGKASTYARKYALLNAYKIATGEDPDADKSEETVVMKPDERRRAVLNYLCDDTEYMNNTLHYFGVGSIQDLTDKHITTLYNNLTKKGRL